MLHEDCKDAMEGEKGTGSPPTRFGKNLTQTVNDLLVHCSICPQSTPINTDFGQEKYICENLCNRWIILSKFAVKDSDFRVKYFDD